MRIGIFLLRADNHGGKVEIEVKSAPSITRSGKQVT
jgi:hypothetical protein